MSENWKDIEGYEGLYKVSDFGAVMNMRKGYITRGSVDSKGYCIIGLSKNGKRKSYRLHRLVAEAFVPNPYDLPQINHIDEDKTNNSSDNLEWCDAKQNINHGTRNSRMADKQRKPVSQYTVDGMLVKVWPSVKDVEVSEGFNHGNISSCCHGKIKSAYGFVWKYE